MTDLAATIAPKSDQLNADDLIAGPKTITITGVRGSDDPDQPVAVHFEGDNRKPWKPCKSMRRVLVHAWGADGNAFVGRSLTLYRDEGVQFGGIKVGGIRISHMSHIERDMTMALTTTRAKRAPYTVKPLAGGQRATQRRDDAITDSGFPGDRPATQDVPLSERIEAFKKRIAGAPNKIKADAMWAAAKGLRDDVDRLDPERLDEMQQAYNARVAAFEGDF